MYNYEVQVVLEYCCTLFKLLLSNTQFRCRKLLQRAAIIIAARCNNYCSALANLGSSYTLTGQSDGALAK